MFTTMIAALALTVSAPKLKDPPKPPAIHGTWELKEYLTGGAQMPIADGTTHEYTSDGKRILKNTGDSEYDRSFQLVKDDPKAIDLFRTLPGNPTEHYKGIFKVEGDTFTICIGTVGGARPTKYESTDENGAILMTFKRAKKE